MAVVGASTNPEKTGNIILKNIIDGGFQGDIYPINPSSTEIYGLTAYPTLTDVPGCVDLVVIVVPSVIVPEVMHQAGKKKAGGAIIISGGFKEIGNDSLEIQVLEIAKLYGIRVIGPNCQGVNYTASNLCASWPLITTKGKMAIISQSGTVAAALGEWAEKDGIGISSFVSLGNKSDVNEVDLVEYFSKDPETAVISIYVEGTGDGRRFIETCNEAIQRKPIIVFRPGRSSKGKKAAESHTKSIAGSYLIFKAACAQAGITTANTIEELYDFSKSFMFKESQELIQEKGRSFDVIILTSSGGSGIVSVDCAEEIGINIPDLNEISISNLKMLLPPHCIIKNPLDLTGDTSAERYETAVLEIASSMNIDGLLLIFGDPILRCGEMVGRLKAELVKRNKKIDIVACYIGGGLVGQEEVLKIHQSGVPVFPSPERAMKALGALSGNRGK